MGNIQILARDLFDASQTTGAWKPPTRQVFILGRFSACPYAGMVGKP